jgi:hypothetical protein
MSGTSRAMLSKKNNAIVEADQEYVVSINEIEMKEGEPERDAIAMELA